MTERVNAYIDGFNLYHSLDGLCRNHLVSTNEIKWLNLRKLMQSYIKGGDQELFDVNYFTAYYTFKEDVYRRHQQYVKALSFFNVNTVLGQFKNSSQWAWCECNGESKKVYRNDAKEEKETDVNIAISLVADAYEDKFDTAFLVSRDTDLVPPVKLVKDKFPNKKVILIAPPIPEKLVKNKYWKVSTYNELVQCTDGNYTIRAKTLYPNILPHEVKNSEGEIVSRIPDKYLKKSGAVKVRSRR